jgi:hypothetical protein
LQCSTAALGLYYVRSRAKLQPKALLMTSPAARYRRKWLENFDFNTAGADQYLLLDDFPTSHLLRYFEIEWTSQMPKQSGVVLSGFNMCNNAGPAVPRAGILVNLNASGFLAVYEAASPTTYTSSTLGAADLSLASHTYRVVLTTGRFGAVQCYVDGTLIGSYTLTQPLWGGLLGLWKFTGGSDLLIQSLYYITEF